MNDAMKCTRRTLLAGLGGAALALGWPLRGTASGALRTVASTGARWPAVGLGSWITFDAPQGSDKFERGIEVMRRFFAAGGGMIDSSPMYGYAQQLIGHGLDAAEDAGAAVSATKVWIPGAERGRAQTEQSMALWGVPRFDVLHVHNLVDWQAHLPWMLDWKAEGRLGHVGVTTSHGRRHSELAEIIRNQPVDVVQFTYNIAEREAERRLLPMAADHGRAVVINRPFRTGALFHAVRGQPLPAFAAELGCRTWAQYFLKWVISHPAVTCAIPATSRPEHLDENMAVLSGPLPDAAMRDEMARHFDSIT